jgi:hypothetical protein
MNAEHSAIPKGFASSAQGCEEAVLARQEEIDSVKKSFNQSFTHGCHLEAWFAIPTDKDSDELEMLAKTMERCKMA